MEPQQQIYKLANFIMAEIPGEPAFSEGAVDTAIRIMREQREEIMKLEAVVNGEETY